MRSSRLNVSASFLRRKRQAGLLGLTVHSLFARYSDLPGFCKVMELPLDARIHYPLCHGGTLDISVLVKVIETQIWFLKESESNDANKGS